MLLEGLPVVDATETNMRIDKADKQLEGFFDQVFEPTAVPRWMYGYNYHSAMTLRLMLRSFQQYLS